MPLDPRFSTLPSCATALSGSPPASPSNKSQDKTSVPVNDTVFARLYGEPFCQVPNDLYIPPDALEIFLETFEGPLDLLLYLIRRQNFNILDIPMAQVTQQYLRYIEQVRAYNLELAAEYLLMAAMLIEIKSRMLLPPKKSELEEEAKDPRAELVRRLLEYEQMKRAAQQIDTLPQAGRDFLPVQVHIEKTAVIRWPDVTAADLQAAWAAILHRAKLNAHHTIARKDLSVREHMSAILRKLQQCHFVEFSDLFDPVEGVAILIVHFIALLELGKESIIDITQAAPFAPIYVRLAHTPEP